MIGLRPHCIGFARHRLLLWGKRRSWMFIHVRVPRYDAALVNGKTKQRFRYLFAALLTSAKAEPSLRHQIDPERKGGSALSTVGAFSCPTGREAKRPPTKGGAAKAVAADHSGQTLAATAGELISRRLPRTQCG